MKLTDAQKFELFKAIVAAVASRPTWPDFTPGSRENPKGVTVSKPFGAAVWAKELTRCAIKVAEGDERDDAPSAGGQSGNTPF